MSSTRLRLLTGALLATIGTFAGNKNAVVPASQHIGIDPLVPRPTPRKKKKANGTSNGRSWFSKMHERWLARWRVWAPAGGGNRECARRRAQIQKGMLGRCHDVTWSDATLAEMGITRAEFESGIALSGQRCIGILKPRFNGGEIKVLGIDPGNPEGDMTAVAHGHREPDGSVVIDDIEFQTAGRGL